ncbi:DNA internalization-related competence protein ComEC/Rec2 [Bacillus sp. MRMR6]|uniref:DNA internalization-related competence protein ComEC/Rec2 n=1 Tax=Bacillus sp. MRMR6 TaxID=1928617 RepID=UPI0009516A0F|nr:DNA internalization-related competence protein ComEC/Rec2 [Bacillus sp. MRMR6]OLS41624.1 DNA internalization-related competence protein ComEC/Rec2 [Bacillus sp. MRMR6]
MNGKFIYFALAALLGVISSLSLFFPFLLLTIIYFYLLSQFKKYSSAQIVFVLGIYVVFFISGQFAELNQKTLIPDSATTFVLTYNENPKIDGDMFQVAAMDARYKEKVILRYRIKSEKEKESLSNTNFYGNVCKVSGKLKRPSKAKNPNSFNYRNYLATKQIFWIVEAQNNPSQNCAQIKPSPVTLIKELRFTGINYLENTFPPEIASLSAALIFGDRSLLSPDVLTAYQRTGIVHLLAISGLHVSLLIGMFFYLGIRFGLTRQFMTDLLLVILPFYAILTGASPSVIRAVVMVFLVMIILKYNRQVKLSSLDAVSLTFIIYLFFSPTILFDAGFQLSFSVSFAIILSVSYILPNCNHPVLSMLAVSIIAQLSALPILLYHFFEVSFISVAANLLYIPLFSFILLPGLYLLFFIQISFHDVPMLFIYFFIKMISLANGLIEHLATYSAFRLVPGRPAWIMLVIYVLLILALFFSWEAKVFIRKKLLIPVLVVMLVVFQVTCNWLNPYGEVTMIDVGQGDSIFIRFPFGKGTYLVDAGGTIQFPEEEWKKDEKPIEVGRDVVVPFLKGKGITKIDKLILTHGDMDHIGGVFSIINEVKVKEIIMPAVAEPSDTEMAIIRLAAEKGIPIVKVSEGSRWYCGKSLFYVLGPEKNYQGERNSGSIAFFANIGGLNWFFGGDLDKVGEEEIFRKYPNLKIDVLKASHHGSETSTSQVFVNKLKPKISLISAGENNRYGHPHQEVLNRLKDSNIYRTDQQGAITYRFLRNHGTFSTYLP